MEMLIERLADEDHPDSVYVDLFLLGYRYLISASSLVDKLITRFNVVPPPNATEEQMEYYNKFANVIKVRVLGVLKKWMDSYWTDFETNEAAHEKLEVFLDILADDTEKSFANLGNRLKKIVVDKQRQAKLMSAILGFDSPFPTPYSCPSFQLELFFLFRSEADAPEKIPAKKSNVEFTILDPKDFAHQLTLLDFEKFAAIAPYEFVIRLWEGAGVQTRNLTHMINWSNRISYFVATEICSQRDLKKRARLLENFIKVAKECRRVQNFNSLMALLSGLNNSSVRRLKKTWVLVSPKAAKEFQQLEELMSG